MWNSQGEELRDRAVMWAGGLILLGIIGIAVYYRFYVQAPAPLPPKTTQQATPPPQPVEDPDAIQHPVPDTTPPDSGLPALNSSDTLVRDSIAGLIDPRRVEQFLVPENIVRHIVATIDNLPRKKVAVEVRPVKSTAGRTQVTTRGDITMLSDKNFARYTPFIKALNTLDARQLAGVYLRLYPLFQQAYEDLGYPHKYFNDRLVQTIDDLIKAPEPAGPLELVQPKVFYEFSDQSMEELSAGQKLMIRMGPAHARAIKEKLKALRAEIIKGDVGKPAARQE